MDDRMPKLIGFLVAAAASLTSIETVSASEAPWRDETPSKPASQVLSRDAQRALVCQTVTDWAAYQVAALIRDDAKENQEISSEGVQILRQIRLTEALASAAFDKLAPQADHASMYQDAVRKMQAYLHEDHDGADANTKKLVPECQKTYAGMAAAGQLTEEQVQFAEDASKESVDKLTEELQGPTAPR
jgi:hypothetical protein